MSDQAARKAYETPAAQTSQGGIVSVHINGQIYPIRSSLDQEYVARLAAYVDERIKVVTDATPSGDSVRVTVLAALNIADELFRCRDAVQARNGELAERTIELERLVDAMLIS
jgi:cell division protein ZapA